MEVIAYIIFGLMSLGFVALVAHDYTVAKAKQKAEELIWWEETYGADI